MTLLLILQSKTYCVSNIYLFIRSSRNNWDMFKTWGKVCLRGDLNQVILENT